MDNIKPRKQATVLLSYLPSIFRQSDFLGPFLMAFEKILLGSDDQEVSIPSVSKLPVAHIKGVSQPNEGLERTIDQLAILIDPLRTRDEFLPWLMNWVALSLRADLNQDQQRHFIANTIQLYNKRGTKENLIHLLGIFTNPGSDQTSNITIDENAIPALRQNELPRSAAHFFKVTIFLTNVDPNAIAQQVARQVEIAKALIELEKPAYTHYDLELNFPSMRIGTATVGVDTLLGMVPYK